MSGDTATSAITAQPAWKGTEAWPPLQTSRGPLSFWVRGPLAGGGIPHSGTVFRVIWYSVNSSLILSFFSESSNRPISFNQQLRKYKCPHH